MLEKLTLERKYLSTMSLIENSILEMQLILDWSLGFALGNPY